MMVTVTEARPGGMLPALSTASTVKVREELDGVKASKSTTLRVDNSPVMGSTRKSPRISSPEPSLRMR